MANQYMEYKGHHNFPHLMVDNSDWGDIELPASQKTAMAQNGTQSALPIVPPAGVWTPAITLINPTTDDVDLTLQSRYFTYLKSTGLTGLIILGSNAESFLLTNAERRALIQTARQAVGPDYPLMAGCSGHSTKQVLEYVEDAKQAGANYSLVLPASYFGKATTPAVIERFYDEVATKSPLPIVIYNFPGVCNGVDLDSNIISTLAKRHQGKIVGVKLTCGSVAKIHRLSSELSSETFSIFGGQSDFLLGGLAAGSNGCICAMGNVLPKTIMRVWGMYKQGQFNEAMKLQGRVSLAEQCIKSGIAATKYAASLTSLRAAGVVGENGEVGELCAPRHPYMPPAEAEKEKIRGFLGGMVEEELKL